MIRTTINGYPIIYQNDNTYSMPNYTGTVQWNGIVKKFQVSTGSGWHDIDNNVSYNVDQRILPIIDWAEKKMREEKELEEKAKNNPTLAALLNQRKDIEEKIKTVEILVR
jgi:hypothetical protein